MSRAASYAFVIVLTVLSGACASTGATPRPFPTVTPKTPGPSPSAPSPVPSAPSPEPNRSPAPLPAAPGTAIGYSLTSTALGLRGTPYRNGGADPSSGFDCSGFVQYVFA